MNITRVLPLAMLIVFIGFQGKSQNLTDSLKVHYEFDGNLLDQTSTGLDLTSTGVSYNSVGANDSSVVFNGTTQASSISSFDNSSFTATALSLWVKSSTITSNVQICLQGAGLGFGAYIEANTGKMLGFFDGSFAGSKVSSKVVTDGLWHHIVVQNDGSTTQMYVDGVFDGSIQEPLFLGTGASSDKLYLGQSNLGLLDFTGELNDLRIYNRVLDPCEVYELSGTPPSPVFTSYPFDSSLMDVSQNSLDLQATGSSPVYEFFAPNDSAIVFDGSTQLASISSFNNSSFKATALSLWVKSTTITSNVQICVQGAGIGFGAYIEANTGKMLGFFDGSFAGSYVSSKAITDGSWHHIVIQNDGSNTYMYVDGVLDGSIAESLFVGTGAASDKLYLGQSNLGALEFTGSLNNIRIYDRLLGNCEIDSLSNIPIGLSTFETSLESNEDLEVYPNPTQGKFFVNLSNNNQDATLLISDISGKVLLKKSYKSPKTISSEIPGEKGIYLIKLVYEDNSCQIAKIVRQ